MHARPDGNAQEAHVIHQEILRLDAMVKKKIDSISITKDERSLLDETKQTRELLSALRSKIEQLRKIGPMLLSRREQQNVSGYIERHEKELEENIQQMRYLTITTSKKISEFARTSLMRGESGKFERQKAVNNKSILKENAEKATERLSGLVSKMSDRVAHSEQTVDDLIHSSTVLAQTQGEFTNQTGHIQTSNKLLSKYERRELTDKILVTIALLFYLAVIYYILQKRVFSKFWLW